MRLKKKIMNLLIDFLINDDGIFEAEPFHVRKYFGGNEEFGTYILKVLDEADLNNMQQYQYREFILRGLFRIYQANAEALKEIVPPVLYKLRG